MDISMNGKQISVISVEGTDPGIVKAEGDRLLKLDATYHGDRDEFWVVQYFGSTGEEITRHNMKYISSVVWV